MIINSHGYRFRRGTGSPFDSVAPAGVDMGNSRSGLPCLYCPTCKQGVDIVEEKYNQHQVWGMKQLCKRCGGVLQSAIYYHVETIEHIDDVTPLFRKAQQWSLEGEKR